MRYFLLSLSLVFVFLFLWTMVGGTAPAQARAAKYFSAEEIENGLQFSLERRLIFWAATFTRLAFWVGLAFSPLPRRWADALQKLCRGRWFPSLVLFAFVVLLANHCLGFPFRLASWKQQVAWGLNHQGFQDWLLDFGKWSLVYGSIELAVLACFYLLVRYFPGRWWILAPLGGMFLAIVFTFLWPVTIQPLFNTFTPLEQTRWKSLQPRVKNILDRAGVPQSEIFVVDASLRGSHTNAYFIGFGPTRRIILFDTLLEKHTPAEIESILAHELGHWMHDHILKGIVLAGLGAFLGFFLLSRILYWSVQRPPFLLKNPADPAGLPLLVVYLLIGSWLIRPVENGISRYFERQADAVSLELTCTPKDYPLFAATLVGLAGSPRGPLLTKSALAGGQTSQGAFIDSEIRLVRDNFINVAPTPFNVWLFSSHPPVLDRIEMAEKWGR